MPTRIDTTNRVSTSSLLHEVIACSRRVTTGKPKPTPQPTPVPASPSSTPPPITIHIEDIPNDLALLQHIKAGHRVVAYRGFDPAYLPHPGEIYCRPYGGTPENQRAILSRAPIEAAIEQVRQRLASSCPPRLSSVFIAPSPAEAGKWGKVYVVEIKLRNMERFSNVPVRWLNRYHYEDLMRSDFPGLTVEEALLETQTIFQYLLSQGNHTAPADILVDPEQVEMTIVGEYVPDENQKINNILEKIFNDDPMGRRPPEDFSDLKESLSTYEDEFNLTSFAELRRRATIRLIDRIRQALPQISEGKILCHAFDISLKDGKWYNYAIDRIEECLSQENNPFPADDPDHQALLSQIQQIRIAMVKTGYIAYWHYLHSIAYCSDSILHDTKQFNTWETQYRAACITAEVAENKDGLNNLKHQYAKNAHEYLQRAIRNFLPSSHGYDHNRELTIRCLTIIRAFDQVNDDERKQIKALIPQITSPNLQSTLQALIDFPSK